MATVRDASVPHVFCVGTVTGDAGLDIHSRCADFEFAKHHAWRVGNNLLQFVCNSLQILVFQFIGRDEYCARPEHLVDLVIDLLCGTATERTAHDQGCDTQHHTNTHEEAAQLEAAEVPKAVL
jgi:hypothetical protein